MTNHVNLRQLDSGRPPTNPVQVSAFAVVHNEHLRLPYMLDYHRRLGVSKFFFVDDKSSDGTREYLLEQALVGDVHVFDPDISYSEARGGLDWIECLADRFADGQWILKLDADELFVYPDCETQTLAALVAHLESERAQGLIAFMLDLYPQGKIADARYAAGEPFFDVAGMFDPSINIHRRLPLITRTSPGVMVTGGVRTRAFYPELPPGSRVRLLGRRIARMAKRRLGPLSRSAGVSNAVPPILEKVPLRKWHRRRSRYFSAHHVDKIKLSRTTGVLLHFKYLQDFHEKVVRANERKQYFDGASEYARYAAIIGNDRSWSLANEHSVRYRSSEQLVDLGFMRRGAFAEKN
jgi:glycosyltransferase involved in cell wall biosynthesis